jgi:uncharacterized protein (TIGR02246 family)
MTASKMPLLAMLLLCLHPAAGVAQAAMPSQNRVDELAIRALAADWESAWNRRDADALAGILADDVDFVTVWGPNGWMKGKAAFGAAHARMFQTFFARSHWKTGEVRVKFLRPDIAIAHVPWSTTGDEVRHIKHGEPRHGLFTWVVERREGRWLVIASQNTEVMPFLPGQ